MLDLWKHPGWNGYWMRSNWLPDHAHLGGRPSQKNGPDETCHPWPMHFLLRSFDMHFEIIRLIARRQVRLIFFVDWVTRPLLACLGLFRTLGMDPAYVHTCDRAALTSSLSILTLLMLSVLEVENRWLLRARPKGKGPPKGHNLNTHFPTKDGFPNPNWTLNSWTPRSLVQLRFHHGTILDTKCFLVPKNPWFFAERWKDGMFPKETPISNRG